MHFNYERRELSARQDYTKAHVQKRDMLARRIKSDDKNKLDINKVIAEIRNGNLAVLEELDKAGITYTLTDNSQVFDGKSDSQTVTFKVGDATYTASYEGLTKEQEEAKKKQEAKGRARLESFLNSYENANTKKREDNTSSNTTSVASQTQPIQDDKPVVAPKPEESATSAKTASTSAETPASNVSETPTTNTSSTQGANSNITVPVDKEKAEALLQELKNTIQNADAKVYVDHGVTNVEKDKALAFVNTFAPQMTEIFMTKYGYTQEFAQILTDAIIEKSFWDNYDRVGAKRLIPNATKDNIMDPDCETTVKTYDTAKILKSVLGYMSDTDSLVYHGNTPEETSEYRGIPYTKSFSELLTFYKGMYHWNHERCTHCKDVVENADLEYSTNDFKILDVILEKYFTKLYPDLSNNGNTSCADMENVINKTLEQVKLRLEQQLNFHESWINNDQGQFPVERLDELDVHKNGYVDDLFKILQEATEYVTDGKYTEVKKALETLIKEPNGNNTYAFDTALAYFNNLINALDTTGINYIETDYSNNTGDYSHNRYLKFSFYGIDYEITLNNDITRGEYPYYCTIQSKPSENYSNNSTLESQLMEILKMASEHPEYKFSPYSNIQKLLKEMNIEYESKEYYYDVDNWPQEINVLNFTFNGKEYEIVNYSDITPVEDNRTIDDITDADLNAVLKGSYTSMLNVFADSHYLKFDLEHILYDGKIVWSSDDEIKMQYNNYSDERDHNILKALSKVLREKYNIVDINASNEENKKAFLEYLLSIGAYNEEDKYIDKRKLVKALCNDVPEFKNYVKALYIQWTKPVPTEQPHVIIRTRATEENTETSYSEETQKYINEAKSHFGISTDSTTSYLHSYLYSLFLQLNNQNGWNLDSIKENMIIICDIISSFPELKLLVTQFFGEDYRTKINSYTENDYNILRCLNCNHTELMNPVLYMLYKVDERMKEYFEQLRDPENKNGYTDVYYK